MVVWSCHIIKNLPWRWATSDNTPTRIILPQNLKRQLLSVLRLMKRIDAWYWNERRVWNKENIFEEEDGKRIFEISLHSFWHDKINPRRDLPFQKVSFWKECSRCCLVVYHNDLHKTTRFGHFPTKFKNQTNGKVISSHVKNETEHI